MRDGLLTLIDRAGKEFVRQGHFAGAAGVHPFVESVHGDQSKSPGGLLLTEAVYAPPQLLHIDLRPRQVLHVSVYGETMTQAASAGGKTHIGDYDVSANEIQAHHAHARHQQHFGVGIVLEIFNGGGTSRGGHFAVEDDDGNLPHPESLWRNR